MPLGKVETLKGNDITNVMATENGAGDGIAIVRNNPKHGEDARWYRLTEMVLLELIKRHEWEIETIGANDYIHSPVTKRVMLNISNVLEGTND